jgi:hypothetical protein
MTSTSRASRKRVEDVEIFQVLEEGTDSDVTIFLSEEDVDGNKPDSDKDGRLYDNSETKWHYICFDNFFSSTNLMKKVTGTRNVQLWHCKGK